MSICDSAPPKSVAVGPFPVSSLAFASESVAWDREDEKDFNSRMLLSKAEQIPSISGAEISFGFDV